MMGPLFFWFLVCLYFLFFSFLVSWRVFGCVFCVGGGFTRRLLAMAGHSKECITNFCSNASYGMQLTFEAVCWSSFISSLSLEFYMHDISDETGNIRPLRIILNQFLFIFEYTYRIKIWNAMEGTKLDFFWKYISTETSITKW